MDSAEIIKIFIDSQEFEKTCIENNISLFNFRYLDFNTNSNLSLQSKYPFLYFTLWNNNDLIAVIKQAVFCGYTYNNFSISTNRTILYVSINQLYQKLGYSKRILDKFFNFLIKENINDEIYVSPYSKMGWNFLRQNLHIYAKKYNLTLKDQNYCYEL